MRGFRRAARQRQAHHQRRRIAADRAAASRPAATPRHSRPTVRHGSRVCWLPGARAGLSLHSAVGGWSATTVRSHAASWRPSRRTVRCPPCGQVAIRLEARLVQRAERLRVSVERQRRRAAAAGDADGEAGAGRHRHRAAVRLEEDRRQPRIGGRRDPGLQLGRRRRNVARQRRLHRLRQPRGRIVAGDREGGDQGEHQRGAQRTRIAPRQTGARQADAQPPHRAHRARDMRLPERDRRRVGSAAAARWPVGQHRERPVGKPGGNLQAAVGRLVVRRGDAAQPAHQQPEDQQRGDREQPDMPPRRQQARQVEQRDADEQAGDAKRRPQRRPDAFEQDGGAGQRATAGKPAQQAIELSARGAHFSQCGTRSPRHKSAWLSRSRITDQLLPSTITSAATGRAL